MESVEKLCVGGCGFFGSPATDGRCSVCHKDFVMEQQLLSAEPTPAATNLSSSSEEESGGAVKKSKPEISTPEKPKKRNRCFTCRKKVGLTGFDCRCGGVFCGLHRYSDIHNCNFDYKKMAAEEIRVKNPVIVCAKIQKI